MNLDNLTREQFNSTLPMAELLENSVYYPACGTDGRPMKYCNTIWRDLGVNCFVYCDYRLTKAEVIRDIENTMAHYKPLYMREVSREEYIPEGWQLKLMSPTDKQRYTENFFGEPHPFALWTVFKRNPNLGDGYGPERFSMLYICGEGVATLQQLYIHHHTAPRMICFIQCWGFAGNWTDFSDRNRSFRMTLRMNPECIPEFVCFGSFECIDEAVRIKANPSDSQEITPVCIDETENFASVFGEYHRIFLKRNRKIGIIENKGQKFLLISVPHTNDSILYHVTDSNANLDSLEELERLFSLTRLHDSIDLWEYRLEGLQRLFKRKERRPAAICFINGNLERMGLEPISIEKPHANRNKQ